MSNDGKPERKPLPGPRPVTATYLRNAAMHYIAGRAASAAMVRQTLERRSMKRLCVRALEPETAAMIDATVSRLVDLGLIDDVRFAETRAATLAGRGLSRGRIVQRLREKGVGTDAIDSAIDDTLDDLMQARRFVVRKRIGPLRRGGMTAETRRRDLAALARAGFAFGVATKALDDPEGEEGG